jgi:glycerophosphoryl diester phosphodiesterase
MMPARARLRLRRVMETIMNTPCVRALPGPAPRWGARKVPAVLRFLTNGKTLVALTLALCGPWGWALDLQGHRGARGLLPENTLPSFARALSIGVTTLETDIAITRDGVLVISHDPSLNPDITRGPDGKFLTGRGPLIVQTDWAELQRYDVGRINPASRYAQTFSAQQAVDGTRLPTLDELFALVRKSGNPEVRFSLETKVFPHAPEATLAPDPFARALINAVRQAGVAARTTIQSFDWRTLQVVQAQAPEIGTVYLSAQQRWLDNIGAGSTQASAWTAGIRHADHGSVPRMVRAAGGRIWSVYFGDLTPALLKEAKDLGLTVLAWTVNDTAQMARLIDMGVDGIITDRPDLLRDEMARRGLPLPRATPVQP